MEVRRGQQETARPRGRGQGGGRGAACRAGGQVSPPESHRNNLAAHIREQNQTQSPVVTKLRPTPHRCPSALGVSSLISQQPGPSPGSQQLIVPSAHQFPEMQEAEQSPGPLAPCLPLSGISTRLVPGPVPWVAGPSRSSDPLSILSLILQQASSSLFLI